MYTLVCQYIKGEDKHQMFLQLTVRLPFSFVPFIIDQVFKMLTAICHNLLMKYFYFFVNCNLPGPTKNTHFSPSLWLIYT